MTWEQAHVSGQLEGGAGEVLETGPLRGKGC